MENNQSLGNVLVVGANGLLGAAIIDLLLQDYGKPKTITAFDIKEDTAVNASIKSIKGDVRNLEDLEMACQNIDTVFHTAAIVNFNPKNNAFMHAVNVDGTKNILKACEKNNVGRFIYTSSMDVVYEGNAITNGDESLPYAKKHVDHYSHTKTEAEQFVLTTNSTVAKCAMRATGIYGPNDTIRFSTIVNAVKAGKYAKIGNNENAKYSHVFAGNCAYAHILAAQSLSKDGKLDGEAYFVTDGSTDNFHRFVSKILTKAGYQTTDKVLPVGIASLMATVSEFWVRMPWVSKSASPLITKNAISSLTKDLWFNSNKAKKDFGYEPLFSLEEAIDKTANWIKNHFK